MVEWLACARNSVGWGVYASTWSYRWCKANMSSDFRPAEGV